MGQQNYALPPGTQAIHADDPWRPGQKRLVGARDRHNIHFFRPQDHRHYPVAKRSLFDPDEIEVLELIDRQARATGLLPLDVAKRMLAGQNQAQLLLEGEEVMRLLKPVALRHKLDLVLVAQRLAEWAELVLEIQAAAMLEGVGAAEMLQAFQAWRQEQAPV